MKENYFAHAQFDAMQFYEQYTIETVFKEHQSKFRKKIETRPSIFQKFKKQYFQYFLRNASLQCDHKKQKKRYISSNTVLCFDVAKSQ